MTDDSQVTICNSSPRVDAKIGIIIANTSIDASLFDLSQSYECPSAILTRIQNRYFESIMVKEIDEILDLLSYNFDAKIEALKILAPRILAPKIMALEIDQSEISNLIKKHFVYDHHKEYAKLIINGDI